MLKIIKTSETNQALKDIIYQSSFTDDSLNDQIKTIIEMVKEKKDETLYDYILAFDQVKLDNLKVSEDEIERAYELVNQSFIDDLKQAKQNIEAYHKKEMIQSFEIKQGNSFIGQRVSAIEKVALYVPGERPLIRVVS